MSRDPTSQQDRAARSGTVFEGKRLLEVNRMATYEVVRGGAADSPAEVVTDLPPAELGEVIFHEGHFWRVDAIEPARSGEADGRLIVSPTTDEPKSGAT
jgi:hypothetical protein